MQHAVPSTIAEVGFRSLYIAMLKWLLDVNSGGLDVRLRLVAAFLAGILAVRGSASCLAIGKIAHFSHDAFYRLLTSDSLRGFLQMLALHFVPKRGGKLVIDDTIMAKAGKLIEGIKWLYDSSSGEKVLALNPVVLGWTNGRIFIPLSFRFWKRPLDAEAAKKLSRRRKRKKGEPPLLAFDGSRFRTKIELAIELLDWAAAKGLQPEAVLFDAAYCAAPVLKRLKKWGWQWVSRIKGNRCLRFKGGPFKAEQWAAMAKAGQAPRLSRSLPAELPGWGPVRVIAVKPRPGDKKWRFLIGSDPGWKRPRIEGWYGERWSVETFFRESNQLLSLKACQCGAFGAQENFFSLVLMAFIFLQSQKRGEETTGDVLDRLTLTPVVFSAVVRMPNLRPVKKERRRRRQVAHDAGISRVAA